MLADGPMELCKDTEGTLTEDKAAILKKWHDVKRSNCFQNVSFNYGPGSTSETPFSFMTGLRRTLLKRFSVVGCSSTFAKYRTSNQLLARLQHI